MSSWNIMREWAKKLGQTIYEFEEKEAKNNENFDRELDSKVREFWINNDDFVYESRLAWYFIPDSYKICLKCDEDERYRRIKKRENIDINDVIEKNKKRESELKKRYTLIYPEINFPPKEEYFDIVIDSTKIDPDEIVDMIISKIWIKYMTF